MQKPKGKLPKIEIIFNPSPTFDEEFLEFVEAVISYKFEKVVGFSKFIGGEIKKNNSK